MSDPKSPEHKQSLDLNQSDCTLDDTQSIIKEIENIRKSRVLVVICHQSIGFQTSMSLNKMLRKIKHLDHLDIILESGGGDIDSAYKILNLFKSYADKITIIVPSYAKSAATLIALGADELIVCKAGELGPLDPQVRDPQTNSFVPAHSIKETMSFIEEVNDPVMKLSLTDKIPALLIGAYRASGKSCKQYLDEILTEKKIKNKDNMIKTFTEKFLSHGYPMHREFLVKNHIALVNHNDVLEDKIYDLYEKYANYCKQLYCDKPEMVGELLLLQSNDHSLVMLEDEELYNN